MSHNTHIFLMNQDVIDGSEAMRVVDNCLINNPPAFSDYFNVIGAINLSNGEYEGEESNEIRSISDLEEFANSLYSKEIYNQLKSDLERFVKSEMYWNAKCACERLDGISYAKSLGFRKWKANPNDSFAINDGYYEYAGITDWRFIPSKATDTYAVIVDFHS